MDIKCKVHIYWSMITFGNTFLVNNTIREKNIFEKYNFKYVKSIYKKI